LLKALGRDLPQGGLRLAIENGAIQILRRIPFAKAVEIAVRHQQLQPFPQPAISLLELAEQPSSSVDH
jgi:hypothetical protein